MILSMGPARVKLPQQLIQDTDKMPYLWLCQLFIRAQFLALFAHLFINQGLKYNDRDPPEPGIFFYKLCQPVPVHLGHLDIRNDQVHLLV